MTRWSVLAITYSNPPLSLSLTRRSRTFFAIWFTLLAALVCYAKERTQLKKTGHCIVIVIIAGNIPRMNSQRTCRFCSIIVKSLFNVCL